MAIQASIGASLASFERALGDTVLPPGFWEGRLEFLNAIDEFVLPTNLVLAFLLPDVDSLSPGCREELPVSRL